MNPYIIITDSCVDLPSELASQLALEVIPLSVNIEGTQYYNYLDERDLNTKGFYQLLREGEIPSTSQINPQRFSDIFEKYLSQGYDILYIAFSSALSGTYNSALIAKEELINKYPHQKILIIDSLSASMGQGLLVTYAARLKESGKTINEVYEWVENNKLRLCHLFTVGDLNHLRRGGRLSYAKALIGTILRIKPLLHVNTEGKLVQTGATRGRKSSLEKLVSRMIETIENAEEQVIYISHGDCLAEVEELKEIITNRLPVKDVIINFVGPVIGTHSGVDTIAIFYLGNDRTTSYK